MQYTLIIYWTRGGREEHGPYATRELALEAYRQLTNVMSHSQKPPYEVKPAWW